MYSTWDMLSLQTEVGNIHADIQAAAEEDNDTPLKRKLNAFGELLALVCCWHLHLSCRHGWLTHRLPHVHEIRIHCSCSE